ncbi:aldolase/citrate lyase family protein [Bradyrhizobium sp.]|uniref:aldolase/citrate lyase family protein n=1 Tax=Bradyrhizobium sp. TaxID=376 RepID=UPI0039E699C9
MQARRRELRSRWTAGGPLFGIFVRLSHEDVFETIGLTSVDLVVLDAEHGSLDRERLNRCLLAAQAVDIPVLVRLPGADLQAVQHCMSIGAQGVIIPHVNSADDIAPLARFAKGKAIERAYAGAGRASLQRTMGWEVFRAEMMARFVVVAQLDEPECLDDAEAVAAIDEIDGLFLGTIGFALSQRTALSPAARQAGLEGICRLGRAQGRMLGISLTDSAAARDWRAHGVSLYVVDSDAAVLRKGIEDRIGQFRSAVT